MVYALVKNKNWESKYYESDEGLSIDEMYMGVYHPVIPIDVVLSANTYEPIICKSIYEILRKGDYFTLDIAKDIVKSYQYRDTKEDRMIEVLESVNESHEIAKARSKLQKKELHRFNKALWELDKILVNPVTIPRRWNTRHIPNLLRAYYDSIYEEQLVPCQEYEAMKRIEEVLEHVRKR